MADMEKIEQVDEDEDTEFEEDGEEDEEEKEVVEMLFRVNDQVTLHQPELCAIYTAIHWAWTSDGNPWSDAEIKQIIGHAILRLNEREYHRLDLGDVIKWFHTEHNALTRAIKPIAEKSKSNLVSWIPQQYEKYLDMCRKDEKLAVQRDEEDFAQEAAHQGSKQTRPEKRRRLEEPDRYNSIAPVRSESSGGSQGRQRTTSASRPSIYYPSIAAVLAGSSTESRDDRDQGESMQNSNWRH